MLAGVASAIHCKFIALTSLFQNPVPTLHQNCEVSEARETNSVAGTPIIYCPGARPLHLQHEAHRLSRLLLLIHDQDAPSREFPVRGGLGVLRAARLRLHTSQRAIRILDDGYSASTTCDHHKARAR